jgi:hypothetical protein
MGSGAPFHWDVFDHVPGVQFARRDFERASCTPVSGRRRYYFA